MLHLNFYRGDTNIELQLAAQTGPTNSLCKGIYSLIGINSLKDIKDA